MFSVSVICFSSIQYSVHWCYFRIRHYAGTVTYSITGFIEKNLDKIPKHISSGLYQSKLSIVQNLFPEGESLFEHCWIQNNNFIISGNPKRAPKKTASTSSTLRTSLQTLLSVIEQRKCHYVFCIKPNDNKMPKNFELSLVQHQCRYMRWRVWMYSKESKFNSTFYSSLVPLANLWRNGYYFNLSHTKFLNRYKLLSPYTWPHYNRNSMVECIAQIIRSVPLPAAEFAIGLKKIFIRSPRTVHELNGFRSFRLNFLATLIQKTYRAYTQRKFYLKMITSQKIISSSWRTWRVRNHIWKQFLYSLFNTIYFYQIFISHTNIFATLLHVNCMHV